MKKIVLLLLLFNSIICFAQEFSDSTIVLGIIQENNTNAGKEIYEYKIVDHLNYSSYKLNNEIILKKGNIVIIGGIAECNEKNKYGFKNKFYEIFYKGESYFIETSNLIFLDKDIERTTEYPYFNEISNLSEDEKIKFREKAKNTSLLFSEEIKSLDDFYNRCKSIGLNTERIEKLKDFDEKCKSNGLSIINFYIYNYNKGTIKINFFNHNNKNIKYIYSTVIGYNSVGDPIVDKIKGTSKITLTAIGPLDFQKYGEYEFEYVWHSNVLDNAKIYSIKIQYMDGTVKTITDIKSITMNDRLYRYFYNSISHGY